MKWGRLLLDKRAVCGYAILLVAAAYGLNVARIFRTGMVHAPAAWAVDAIPPALSEVYFGHPVRYTTIPEVKKCFYQLLGVKPLDYQEQHGRSFSARQINPIITELVERSRHPRPASHSYALLETDDDWGIVDFAKLSFVLFGPRVESLTYFYLLLLGVSLLFYVLAFAGSPWRLFLATTYLCALYLLIPAIVYHPQLGSLLALRAFPLLSMVATLHCVLACLFPDGRRSVWKMVLCGLQVVLIVFVYNIRVTTLWQIQIILLALGLSLSLRLIGWIRRRQSLVRTELTHHEPRIRPRLSWELGMAGLVLAGLTGLAAYKRATYPREYQERTQTVTRVFWHNIYSGFAFSPAIARRESLRIDDSSIVQAAGKYLMAAGRTAEWQHISGPGAFRLGDYERIVREMVFAQIRRHPVQVAATLLYYKPRSVARHLCWLWGLRPVPPDLDVFCSTTAGDAVKRQVVALASRLERNPWRGLRNPMVWALVLAAGCTLAADERRRRRQALVGALVVVLGSAMPVLVGYPSAHTMGEIYVTVTSLVFLVAGAAISRLAVASGGFVRGSKLFSGMAEKPLESQEYPDEKLSAR
jgi:hypothetical protein